MINFFSRSRFKQISTTSCSKRKISWIPSNSTRFATFFFSFSFFFKICRKPIHIYLTSLFSPLMHCRARPSSPTSRAKLCGIPTPASSKPSPGRSRVVGLKWYAKMNSHYFLRKITQIFFCSLPFFFRNSAHWSVQRCCCDLAPTDRARQSRGEIIRAMRQTNKIEI